MVIVQLLVRKELLHGKEAAVLVLFAVLLVIFWPRNYNATVSTTVSYTNNGDGTFTEETYSTPRYRTEYHTETYKSPVYRDDPVFATKYYYEIERWIVDREETSEGADSEPYWPEYTLAGEEL